jgi:MoCo/4Fe-4S cofactor protein with predicted Tat translocation signal
MQKVKKYWKGLEQLKVQSDIMDKLEQNEFVEKIPVEKNEDQNSSRRDFFKISRV